MTKRGRKKSSTEVLQDIFYRGYYEAQNKQDFNLDPMWTKEKRSRYLKGYKMGMQ